MIRMKLIRISVYNATIILLEIFTESGDHSLNYFLPNLTVTVYFVVLAFCCCFSSFSYFLALQMHFPGLANINLDLEEFSVSKDLQVRLGFYNNRKSRQWASYATCGSVMTGKNTTIADTLATDSPSTNNDPSCCCCDSSRTLPICMTLEQRSILQ